MKIYRADYREKADNTVYSHECEIQTAQELAAAVRYDHMICRMKDHIRDGDNFEQCDGVMFDIDNTHTDDPEEWRTEKDIAEALPVNYYLVRSRNYMKEKRTFNKKTGKTTIHEPREKWHVYAPLKTPVTNPREFEALILNILALFPFIDVSAIDDARFFYGVEKPHVTFEDNEICIDEYIRSLEPEELRREQEDNLAEFIANVQSGQYKNDKGTQATINKLCDFLKVKNPFSGEQEKPRTEPAAAADGVPEWIEYADRTKSLQWFEEWANYYDVPLGRRAVNRTQTIAISTPCPWEEEHSMNGAENEAVILIDVSGKISFLCRHSHGGAITWRDFRDYYENRPGAPQKRPQKAPGTAYNDFADKNTGSGIKSPGTATESATEAGKADTLPGLLTYTEAVNAFETADNEFITFKSFPLFGNTARIKRHDSVVLAADTGGGKSSLAINFLNDLSENHPCIYVNLEMDEIEVLQRLVSIQSGLELDRIQGYQNDQQTAAAVNIALRNITERKPIQIIQGAYFLEDLQDIIEKSTRGREEPTIVFIDHSLLMDTRQAAAGRYERFTMLSEGLRKMALRYNIILFTLLQQNRAGKAAEEERPKNSSLKESGSWENDATQICFLWYDPLSRQKKLLMTKNRHGATGEFVLNYWKKTQTYTEAKEQAAAAARDTQKPAGGKREKQQARLQQAYIAAYTATNGKPTLQAIAEAADVQTSTVKGWIKEYGGCTIDGVQQEPAGIDTMIEYNGFVKLTPADNDPYQEAQPKAKEKDNRI